MTKKGGILVGAACAGVCAIPLLAPLLAGASLAAVAAPILQPSWEAIACGGLALLAVALLFVRLRPQRSRDAEGASCSLDGSCGCRPKPDQDGKIV